MSEGSAGFAFDDAYSSDGSGVGFLTTQNRQKSPPVSPGTAYVTGTRKTSKLPSRSPGTLMVLPSSARRTSKLPPMSPKTQIVMTPSLAIEEASKDA